eukprot:IDg23835t1
MPESSVDEVAFSGPFCNWFAKHRDSLMGHFEDKAPACTPPPMWWILLMSVQAFMKPVDICFRSMQGHTTIISEQYIMLENLVFNLKCLVEVDGPLPAEDVITLSADVQRVTRESYSVTRESIRNFIADLGHLS